MNFDDAIRCHTAWKTKLSVYIQKPNGSLSTASASDDKHCDLGKWLSGDGRAHSQVPEFAKLKEAHERFHRAAADVIRRADSGQRVTDEVALGGSSPYATASSAVVTALMAMKAKLHG